MTLPPSFRSAALTLAVTAGIVAVPVLLPGCAAKASTQAGSDMEISRNIKLEMRKDPRFKDVQVVCEKGVVTLRGRVDDLKTARDAVDICKSCSPNPRIMMRLDVRPR